MQFEREVTWMQKPNLKHFEYRSRVNILIRFFHLMVGILKYCFQQETTLFKPAKEIFQASFFLK